MKRSKLILSVLSALILLSGCSTPQKIRKYNRAKERLLKSGLTIPKDTLYITKTDTLVETYTKNDSIYTIIRITDTVTLEPTIEYKTRWQTKYETKYKFKTVKVENKAMVDSLNRVIKLERQETKQTRIENRSSKWWLWLVIGFVVGYLLNIFINLRQIWKLTK